MYSIILDTCYLQSKRFEVLTRALDSLYYGPISDMVDIGLFQKMAYDGMKAFGFKFDLVDDKVQIEFPPDIPPGKLLVESDGSFVKFSFTDNPNLPIII